MIRWRPLARADEPNYLLGKEMPRCSSTPRPPSVSLDSSCDPCVHRTPVEDWKLSWPSLFFGSVQTFRLEFNIVLISPPAEGGDAMI